jgi:hypothetical protein
VSRIRETSEGGLKAEVKWDTWINGYNRHLLLEQVNLTSSQTKGRMEKPLREQMPLVDWPLLIEQLAVEVVDHFRAGEPVIEVESWEDPVPMSYLVEPIWPKMHPAVIFGRGGSGKSFMGLMMAICVQLPWSENRLGLKVGDRPTRVLYLDWETESDEIHRRLRQLLDGMGLPPMPLLYRRCSLSLADDVDRLAENIRENAVEAIVIDSLAAASGGDPTDAQVANRFFDAVRKLKTSSLIIAHTSKGDNGDKTIFGSVFNENRARSVWHLEGEQDDDTGSIGLMLKHTKVNVSGRQKPMGYRLDFNDGTCRFLRVDPNEIPGLADRLPLDVRVVSTLRGGGFTAREIAQELGSDNIESIKVILSRLKQKGRIVQIDQRGKEYVWGLTSDRPEQGAF